MLRTNNNIIGYLQKKAFFSKSPSPSPNSRFNSTPPKPTNHPTPNPNHRTPTRNIFNLEGLAKEGKIRSNVKSGLLQETVASPIASPEAQKPKAKIYDRKPFESSRVEVKMCMEQLLGRVSVELRMLEGAITELTVSLQTQFYRKLQDLKQQLFQSIDSLFAQARNNLDNVLTHSSEDTLKKLLKSKHSLTEADRRLKELKTGMESSWRKVAGEILVDELDQKVEKLLQDSESIRTKADLGRKQTAAPSEQAAWTTLRKHINSLISLRCG